MPLRRCRPMPPCCRACQACSRTASRPVLCPAACREVGDPSRHLRVVSPGNPGRCPGAKGGSPEVRRRLEPRPSARLSPASKKCPASPHVHASSIGPCTAGTRQVRPHTIRRHNHLQADRAAATRAGGEAGGRHAPFSPPPRTAATAADVAADATATAANANTTAATEPGRCHRRHRRHRTAVTAAADADAEHPILSSHLPRAVPSQRRPLLYFCRARCVLPVLPRRGGSNVDVLASCVFQDARGYVGGYRDGSTTAVGQRQRWQGAWARPFAFAMCIVRAPGSQRLWLV